MTVLRRLLLIDPRYLVWLYPELARFTSYDIRGMVWRHACLQHRVFPRTLLTIVILLFLLEWHGLKYTVWSPGAPWFLTFALPAMLFVQLVWVVISRRSAMRETLRGVLAARGLEVGINCAYELSLNTPGVCPECGVPLPVDLLPFEDTPVDDPDADLFEGKSDPADR